MNCKYYNRPAALEALKYTEFLEKYNTSSKQPKYYKENPDTENNVSVDWHYFKVHMDAAGIQYVHCPVRQVKRCIFIEMLYVTSGDIFYLRLILLNRKVHSDQDVLVVSRQDMYRTKVLLYRTMVLMARLTKVRR